MSDFKGRLMAIKAFAFDVDGVLSKQTCDTTSNGIPIRTANVRDGFAIHKAVKLGYNMAIITGGDTEAVEKRYQSLGINDIYLKASNKIEQLNHWLELRNLKASEVLYMGDDLPDVEVMKTVGVAVCPNDAVPEIKAVSHHVSPINSGEGCVRDIVEQVLRAQNKWGEITEW